MMWPRPKVSWSRASRTDARVLMFGDEGDVGASDVRVDAELRASFVLRSPWGDARVRLAALGRHQVANALAAATTALALDVPLAAVVDALGHAQPPSLRI